MKPAGIRLSVLSIISAILALAGFCLFTPSQAAASCGDYVTSGTKPGPAATAARAMPWESHARASDSPKPCSGPMCSGVPLSLPMSSALSVPTRAGEWACGTSLQLVIESSCLNSILDNGHVRPIHGTPAIYHPPRFRAPR